MTSQPTCCPLGGGCRESSLIFAITRDNRLLRLMFSRSLAELIVGKDPALVMKRYTILLDKPLAPGERSLSGLYALVARESGVILRVSLIQGVAELHRDSQSRDVYSAWIGEEAPVGQAKPPA